MSSEYPYDACPQCGGEVDEDELYIFCLDQDCGWNEELPDDPRFLDTPDSADTDELLDLDEEE